MFRFILAMLALLAALAGLLVGTLNPETVQLDLLFISPSLPLGMVLVGGFCGGVLGGLLLAWVLFGIPGGLRRLRGRKVAKSESRDLRARDE